jgi:hypothetical protein
MVLMDSQLYDYKSAGHWEQVLDEVLSVGGEASLIWHQQAFSPDYGWAPGYERVLRWLAGRR